MEPLNRALLASPESGVDQHATRQNWQRKSYIGQWPLDQRQSVTFPWQSPLRVIGGCASLETAC